MSSSAAKKCPQCGTLLRGASAVEGLCSACLLSLGLSEEEASAEATPPPPRTAEAVGARVGRPRTLRPVDTGVVAPAWAMPAELLRQAARRLRLAAMGLGLASAVAIVLNNLVEAIGWHSFSNLAIKNVLLASMVAVSTAIVWFAHSGRLTPARLLRVSLGYEIVVALVISISDHLAPLQAGVPFATISWLCVWIVIFPLVVPASPRWALVAGVASASTWPVGYLFGLALGNPPATGSTLLLACLSNYIAAAVAMFSTIVIRQLQELGCYQLVEKLDHGGMGEIWRARHRMLARPVAVKLIRPELLGLKSPVEATALVSRFEREAQATAALHSAHTVALHDFGVTPEGAFYYVMELLEGLDLETLVRRFGPVPPERAIHFLVQACDSLAEAHAVGLVHRDVKPANIVACHWGLKWDFVKVLDFGLVKATWSMGDDDHLTSDGVITGTPAYMAPEAVLGGRGLDARVDLYGLGAVAYWLLTGERVFAGRTPVEVLLHHVKTAPIPPSERTGTPIPASLEALVLSCLAKDPDERPASAEWLAARLAECETAGDWTPARAHAWWDASGAGGGPTAGRDAGMPGATASTPVRPTAPKGSS
jgi:eukaryotic-like serine/threonine-protein kinase